MDKLDQAIASIKTGDKEKGKLLLAEIIKQNPRDENAWLWMSKCVDLMQQKEDCFRKVLAINPSNSFAQEGLRRLGNINPKITPAIRKTPRKFPLTLFLISFTFVCVAAILCFSVLWANSSFFVAKPTPTSVPVVLDAFSLMGKSLDQIRNMYPVETNEGIHSLASPGNLPFLQTYDQYFNGIWVEYYFVGQYVLSVYYDKEYVVDGLQFDVTYYDEKTRTHVKSGYDLNEWLAVSQMLNLGLTTNPDYVEKDGLGYPSKNIWTNHNGYRIEMKADFGKIFGVWIFKLGY